MSPNEERLEKELEHEVRKRRRAEETVAQMGGYGAHARAALSGGGRGVS